MIDGPKEYADWREQARGVLEEMGPLTASEEVRLGLAFQAGIVRGICCSLAEVKEMGIKSVGMRIGKV